MVVHLKKKKKSIVKNTTNFTIGLQIGMSSITKKNNLKIHYLDLWNSSIEVIVTSYCEHFVVFLLYFLFSLL